MKTNEEKLKQLLTIAVENGWNPYYPFSSIIDNKLKFQIYKPTLTVDFKEIEFKDDWVEMDLEYSLNDLVTNWEKGEISFIEALCKNQTWRYLDWKQTRKLWDTFEDGEPRPTSERLDWLFDTFKHLLLNNKTMTAAMTLEKSNMLDFKSPIKFREIDQSKINKSVTTIEEEMFLLEKEINKSYLSKDSELLGMNLYNAGELTHCLSESSLFHYSGLRYDDINYLKYGFEHCKYNVSIYTGNILKNILNEIIEKDKFLDNVLSKTDLGSFVKIKIINKPYIKYNGYNIETYIPSLLIAAPAKDFTNPKSYVDVLDPIVFKLISINDNLVYIKIAQWF